MSRWLPLNQPPVSVFLIPSSESSHPRIYTKTPLAPSHFASLPPYRAIRLISQFAPPWRGKREISYGASWSCSPLRGNFSEMSAKVYIKSILLLVAIVFVMGAENYIDYGDEVPEKSPAENIHELYRLLLQRSVLDNNGFGEVPLEHLMIRKSQRSPSLRLRFGRSDPRLSMGGLSRNDIPLLRLDDN